jgi:hypothetical protein
MATPTDTNRELLTVIARMHAKPGKEQELRDALVALVEPTSKEKGYVNYDLHQGSRIRAGSSSTRTGTAPRTWTPICRRRTWSSSRDAWTSCSTRAGW